MTLPFDAEFTSSMVKRYPDAILETYVTDGVEKKEDMKMRLGENREHVFDFYDGIRLIISKEMLKSKEYIHLSGSVDKRIYNGTFDLGLLNKMVEHFREISHDQRGLKYLGLSKGAGIPHWVIEL